MILRPTPGDLLTSPAMPPFFEPNWVEAENQEPSSPDSLVIFVVAKLGPNSSGQHYPLAVVRREGGLTSLDAVQGRDVLAAIQGTIAVFSDPANHIGIQSELSLAAQFYQDPKNALPQTELSNLAPWMRQSIASECDRGLREFPFISTCLMLGVAFDRERGVGLHVLLAALGTVLRDANIEYAMAVVDISNLDAIRYGIVAFRTTTMIHISCPPEDLDDDWGADPPGQRELKLEENRTRDPLSAAAYMAKFQQYEPCDDLVDKLNRVGLVDTSALDRIWPPDVIKSLPPPVPPCGAEDAALVALINSLIETERIDISETLLSQLGSTTNYKQVLRRHLQEQCQNIGHLRSTGQLLGLALANEPHLNLAPFTKLSALSISAAIETAPVPPTSISLTIDTLLDPPTSIIDVLAAHPTLKAVYLLQQPARTSDHPSTTFFLALASHPSNTLARLTKLHISGAYSAPLRKEFFLPPSLSYQPPITIYPVLHLFTRHQAQTGSVHNPDPDPDTTSFWPNHLYLGDALLRPERFAAGFLLYLRSLLTCTHTGNRSGSLFSFACAPPNLSSDQKTRVEVGPIPGENFAIPVRPQVWTTDEEENRKREFWPAVRDLVQGSWSVVVERRVWIDVGNKGEAGRGLSWMPDLKTAYVRYAFVRVKVGGIKLEDELERKEWNRKEERGIREGEAEVTGLKGFLETTAPGVDLGLVNHRVDEFVKEMEGWPGQGALADGMEKLSVLGKEEARKMLGEFLSGCAEGSRRT